MSYFVVQVRTGCEIMVKNMLQRKINETPIKNVTINSIYAAETFTQIQENEVDTNKKVCDNDLRSYVDLKNLQAGLNNLRVAYEQLKIKQNDLDSFELLGSYREQIKLLTKQVKSQKAKSHTMSSVIKGYILIEVREMVACIDNALYHVIQSIPNVVGIPNRNEVPKSEIDEFFSKLDLTSECVIELGEVENETQNSDVKRKNLLEKANKLIGTKKEKDLLVMYDNLVRKQRELESVPTIINKINGLFKSATRKYALFRSTFLRCEIFVHKTKVYLKLTSKIYNQFKDFKLTVPNLNIRDLLNSLYDVQSLLKEGAIE
ncbi:hypothetical protein ACQKM9_17405 [Viridibacillus sp. NPDC093762]|uniref:hypothetical protein n=1 Tax=Viridibacillus sp. NPDC093762 TaxID=3390720 RepID=UPI003D055C70